MGGWTGKSHRPLPRGRRSRNHPDQPEQSKPSDQGVGRGGGAGWPPVVPSQCPTIESARGRGCGAARPLRAPPRGRTCPMDPAPSMAMPSNHTSGGGVLMGRDDAMHQMVVFEDPQCPYCRQFEEACGDVLRSGWEAGTLAVEFRMRCFLGVESVRANNALALAAEANRFDELRRELFASQPREGTGGFTTGDLRSFGRRAGLTGESYVTGVDEGRYEPWVRAVETTFEGQDPNGTPAAWLDGQPVDPGVLGDPRALGVLVASTRSD